MNAEQSIESNGPIARSMVAVSLRAISELVRQVVVLLLITSPLIWVIFFVKPDARPVSSDVMTWRVYLALLSEIAMGVLFFAAGKAATGAERRAAERGAMAFAYFGGSLVVSAGVKWLVLQVGDTYAGNPAAPLGLESWLDTIDAFSAAPIGLGGYCLISVFLKAGMKSAAPSPPQPPRFHFNPARN